MGFIRHFFTTPALVLVTLILLAGCKTEQGPENPTVLGIPPNVAYLGVDYSYNFGAYGGDNLPNFSLSNAPAWMALETTQNKARPGIVLRGQPGISGGRRGDADIGSTRRIQITSNDGAMFGSNGFEVEVRHNALKVVGATVEEGKPYIPDSAKNGNGNGSMCELPVMDETHPVTVRHRKLAVLEEDEYGNVDLAFHDDVERTYDAYPILIEVTLDQPSVEPVMVKFEVRDNFDTEFAGVDGSENCPDVDDPVQQDTPCEYRNRGGNRTKAIYGEDFVLYSGEFSDPPEYLQYLDKIVRQDGSDHTDTIYAGAQGLLTFEPGITRCFIRAEVMDDKLAEDEELFTVELLEVVEGLASINRNGAVSRATIRIRDNAPSLSLEPEEIVLSRGQTHELTARLDRPNKTNMPMRALIRHNPNDDSTADENDFLLRVGDESWSDASNTILLEFPPNAEKATFEIQITGDGLGNEPRKVDELLIIQADPHAQYGAEYFVRGQDAEMNIHINEWADNLPVTGYTPTSIAAGSYGELYLAGLGDNGGPTVFLESINRMGSRNAAADDTQVLVDHESTGGSITPPVIAFADRQVGTRSKPELRRDLALAFATDGVFAGTDGADNGSDNIALAYFRSMVKGYTPEDDNGDGNGEELKDMRQLWRKQIGSDKDDRPDQLLMNHLGNLYLGGVTRGDWVDPASGDAQPNRGSGDILLAGFDTVAEGDEGEFRGARVWTRVLGSAVEDRFGGMGDMLRNGIRVVGSTAGELVSGSSVGGEDFVFTNVSTDGTVVATYQFGTHRDDRFTHGAVSSRTVWGAGASRNRYFVNLEDRLPRLERDPSLAPSENPFIFVNQVMGNPRNAIVLESHSAIADQTVSAIVAHEDRLFIAGDTDGAFVEGQDTDSGGYLAVVSYDAAENELTEKWRIQIPDSAGVVDMDLQAGRKLFLLVREHGGGYSVRLYNTFGDALTE